MLLLIFIWKWEQPEEVQLQLWSNIEGYRSCLYHASLMLLHLHSLFLEGSFDCMPNFIPSLTSQSNITTSEQRPSVTTLSRVVSSTPISLYHIWFGPFIGHLIIWNYLICAYIPFFWLSGFFPLEYKLHNRTDFFHAVHCSHQNWRFPHSTTSKNIFWKANESLYYLSSLSLPKLPLS